ncbi:MAG: hypothetical protein WDN01_06450 [Rhizomicrobium sp.]
MKRWIVLAALLAASIPAADAGPRDDVVDVLAKCTDVADREARIACYDRAAPQLRAAAGLPPAPPAAPESTPPPPPVQTATAPPPPSEAPPPPSGQSFLGSLDPFGEEAPAAPLPAQMAYQPIGQELLPITIGVTDYDVAPGGPFTVTLANGQVWRERNGHSETPPFKAGARNFVRIEHGLIGGYDLYLVGYGKLYKVMRIK